MSPTVSPRVRAWAPHLVVALWLAFLGVTIWLHAARSIQSPLWDPDSYLVKAKTFWEFKPAGAMVMALLTGICWLGHAVGPAAER